MKWFVIFVVAIVALFGALYLVPTPEVTDTATTTPQQSAMRSYESADLGISFQYPESYTLNENNASKAGEESYHIVIADTEALAEAPQNGEGPTAITFDIFEYDATSTEAWIRATPQSNFQLSPNGVLTPVDVDGTSGFTYVWDGLYRGASVVFEHKDRIIMASVTMMEPTDAISMDFARLLNTLQLD